MNVALRPRTAIELFAGAAGLALGLKRACPELRTVAYVEREAYAASVLVARMEDAQLDLAPVWDDVSTFDGRPFRGRVDLVAGGFPCQDISNAGKRAGIEGERSGLWKQFARIIAEVQPRFVFIENVSALVARGLEVVLEDLAALGFDAEWGCFRASDAGAPHRRERVFILAHAASDGRLTRRTESDGRSIARSGVAVANTSCIAEREPWNGSFTEPRRDAREDARGRGDVASVADSDSTGLNRLRCGGLLDGERSRGGSDADGRSGARVHQRSGEDDATLAGTDDAAFWRTYRSLDEVADTDCERQLRARGDVREQTGSDARDSSPEELGDADLARLEGRGGA